jgi:two-component system nitrogen regulation response regulator NtrX
MTKKTKATILIVDDEESIVETLTGIFEDDGYEVVSASTGEKALEYLNDLSPEVILLDVWMPGMDGIETLKMIRENNSDVSIIMISGHSNIDTAVQAIKFGAYDFLEKPLSLEKVLLLVGRALESQRLRKENIKLKTSISQNNEIIGNNPKIQSIREEISRAASSQSKIIIYGDSGSGKELVARALHEESSRNNNSFIEVNCAAIPNELIESELFGHEKGSFTGAFERKKGKFELADDGTLFLDEIGDMSLTAQAKVLRVIETQEFIRVGGSKNIKVDVRIIAATNKDLQKEIEDNKFREDLYFRLNVIPIRVPPLKDRSDDIPLLVDFFLNNFAVQYGQKIKKINKATLQALMDYDWPGNVRELKNTVERFVIMSSSDNIDMKELYPVREEKTSFYNCKTLREARTLFESSFILKKLQSNRWNVTKTAEELEIERSNLHRKIKSLGIEIPTS